MAWAIAFGLAINGVSYGSWVEYDTAACDDHMWHKGNCYVLSVTKNKHGTGKSQAWEINHQVQLTLSAEDGGAAVLARAWQSPADSIGPKRLGSGSVSN